MQALPLTASLACELTSFWGLARGMLVRKHILQIPRLLLQLLDLHVIFLEALFLLKLDDESREDSSMALTGSLAAFANPRTKYVVFCSSAQPCIDLHGLNLT